MGIEKLIDYFKKNKCCQNNVNISLFTGHTVVVDAYHWLYRAVNSDETRIDHLENDIVEYCMAYVNCLLSKDINPILVFDGLKLLAKKEEEDRREKIRKKFSDEADDYNNNNTRNPSNWEKLKKLSLNITHKKALNLIRACRERNIDCIVAPFEADAQLAYFNINNKIAEVVITEDSDLLVFGAEKVFIKMNKNGYGTLLEPSKLLRLKNLTFNQFRRICILSGCDYLKSLNGVGLSRAEKFIRKIGNQDFYKAVQDIKEYLSMSRLYIPQDYLQKFKVAEFLFKHQPVFDPFLKKVVPLMPFYLGNIDELKNMFSQLIDLDNENFYELALGNLDPDSKTRIEKYWKPNSLLNSRERFHASYRPSIWEIKKINRRKNIMIHGVIEGNETYFKLEQKVMNIFRNLLNLIIKDYYDVSFIRRIGMNRSPERERPILVGLNTYEVKDSIMNNKNKLQGENIYISEDFPKRVVQRRKELVPEMLLARQQGKKAYLRYDKLIILDRNRRLIN